MRRLACTMGFLCDMAVLAAAFVVVAVTFKASLVEPTPAPVQPPQVDWSESYKSWSGNTGEPEWQNEWRKLPLPEKEQYEPSY